jgi:competence protein ComEC
VTGLLVGLAVYIVSLGHWPAAMAIAIVAVVAARWWRGRALLVGAFSLLAAWWIGLAVPPALPAGLAETQGWRLQISSMPQIRAQGWSFDARILDGPGEGDSLLIFSSVPDRLVIGDRIYVYGTVVRREDIAGSYGGYLTGRGVSGQLYVGGVSVDHRGSGLLARINRIRQETIGRLFHAVPGDAGALLAGLVTGDDGQLSERSDTFFRNAGLSHLTAVSGANLGMMVAMVASVGRLTGRRRTSWLIAGAALAWIYAIFVGLSPPTLRAALLTTGIAGGRLAGRPVDMLTLAFTTAAVQLFLRPIDAYSISFHLSTAASIGLAAGLNRYPAHDRRIGLADLVIVTALAQLATLPFIAATFGNVPLLAIPANVIAVPLASFAFTLALAGSVLLWISATLGQALLIPATWAADGILGAARLYGREWGVIELAAVGSASMAIGLLLVAALILMAGGELGLAARQMRMARGKIGPGG